MPKYVDIANAIRARVDHGDYRLRGFPSHAGLVDELGVNSRTVTKALSTLIKQGVLVRQRSGRVDVRDDHAPRVRHIGVLSPTYPSESNMTWHHQIHRACQDRGWVVKPVVYSHWHDTAITESLRGLDGLFFISKGDNFPKPVVDQIKAANTPVVALEQDTSAHDIPCLRYANPASISQLIEHLMACGHRRIACLNTQPDSSVIRERIQAWQLWTSAHGVQGPLIDSPVPIYDDAAIDAHRIVRDTVGKGALDATALVCTTFHIAIAAMRGVIDAGKRPGCDMGICSVEEWTGVAGMLPISLTCLQPPQIKPLLQVCLDYFAMDEKQWMGPLLIQPASMELFVGESTLGFAHS